MHLCPQELKVLRGRRNQGDRLRSLRDGRAEVEGTAVPVLNGNSCAGLRKPMQAALAAQRAHRQGREPKAEKAA